ncbi:MAG TPA: hypothetical protein VLI54_06410 [Bacillota bacterium]|nr:hypothetical protein [Bacillota bacterium]
MINIKTIAQKLQDLEKTFSAEPINKPVNFLALFLRDDHDKWDLLVSADWLNQDQRSGIQFLVSEFKKTLTNDEILKLSSIVPIPTGIEIPPVFTDVDTTEGVVELREVKFYNNLIGEAYIIKARGPRKESTKA